MITVRFLLDKNQIGGFTVSGHSLYDDRGKDIVCAAVSSAALMTANALTEVFCEKANAECKDGFLSVTVKDCSKAGVKLLNSFRLHMTEMAKEYPQNIKIIYGGKAKCSD